MALRLPRRRTAFARLALMTLGIMTSALAEAQDAFSFETDSFYVRANRRDDLRIGVRGDFRLETNRMQHKMEVNFYDAARLPQGYTTGIRSLCDPDFVVNDNLTEMIVEDAGEGRMVGNALRNAAGDVRVVVVAHDGRATFTLPAREVKALAEVLKRR